MARRVGAILFALLSLAALFAFVQYFPLPRNNRFWDCAFDTGHILIFGFVGLVLLIFTKAMLGAKWTAWQYIVVVGIASVMGLLLEIWQTTVGRDSEWVDLFSDVVGIVAFAAVYAMFDDRWTEPRRGIVRRKNLAIVAAVVLLAGLVPMMFVVDMYRARNAIYPRLVDFSYGWEHHFYYVNGSVFNAVAPPQDWPEDAVRPDKVARVTSQPGNWPGFVMLDVAQDWSGYRRFELDVHLDESTEMPFVVRVHDIEHNHQAEDRFRHELMLQPGFQTISIPIEEIAMAPVDRTMDIRRIAGFILYSPNLGREITYHIGDVRLTK